MCLATPVRVTRKVEEKNKIIVESEGYEHAIDTSLIGDVSIGDWLLCHEDLAINKLEETQAKEILEISKLCPHQHSQK